MAIASDLDSGSDLAPASGLDSALTEVLARELARCPRWAVWACPVGWVWTAARVPVSVRCSRAGGSGCCRVRVSADRKASYSTDQQGRGSGCRNLAGWGNLHTCINREVFLYEIHLMAWILIGPCAKFDIWHIVYRKNFAPVLFSPFLPSDLRAN